MTATPASELGILDNSVVINLGGFPDDAQRAARQAHLQEVEANFDPLPFDAAAARAFGRVAASLRRSGRKTAARAYDAMIAAIAVANELPVYTSDPSEFSGIEDLEGRGPRCGRDLR